MPIFRKKQIVVAAEQFTGEGRDPVGVYRDEGGAPYVITIHDQVCFIVPGDWILPEPDWVHFYPCKNDVFLSTYEPLDAPSELEKLRDEVVHQTRRAAFYKSAALSGECPSSEMIQRIDNPGS